MDQHFNPDKQHTIEKNISISGTGLHTGVLVKMTLNPANPGFGYQFQRTDLPNQPIIKADCDLTFLRQLLDHYFQFFNSFFKCR